MITFCLVALTNSAAFSEGNVPDPVPLSQVPAERLALQPRLPVFGNRALSGIEFDNPRWAKGWMIVRCVSEPKYDETGGAPLVIPTQSFGGSGIPTTMEALITEVEVLASDDGSVAPRINLYDRISHAGMGIPMQTGQRYLVFAVPAENKRIIYPAFDSVLVTERSRPFARTDRDYAVGIQIPTGATRLSSEFGSIGANRFADMATAAVTTDGPEVTWIGQFFRASRLPEGIGMPEIYAFYQRAESPYQRSPFARILQRNAVAGGDVMNARVLMDLARIAGPAEVLTVAEGARPPAGEPIVVGPKVGELKWDQSAYERAIRETKNDDVFWALIGPYRGKLETDTKRVIVARMAAIPKMRPDGWDNRSDREEEVKFLLSILYAADGLEIVRNSNGPPSYMNPPDLDPETQRLDIERAIRNWQLKYPPL